MIVIAPLVRIPKHRRSCCAALVNEIGRWPIGFCSGTCEGRQLYSPDHPAVRGG